MKLCLIYNTAPRYREAVFRAIDAEYDCDWYFGETKTDIKEMDTKLLKRVTYYRTFGNPKKFYFKLGILPLLFKRKYQTFFMLAEVRSITDWVFFWLASRVFPKKKVYIWTHGWYGREAGIDAKLKLWLYKHVNGVFVYGDRAKRLLIQQGIPQEKLFAIHNSLDYDKQKILRQLMVPSDIYHTHFGNDNPTLIFIGRLTKVKKLDMVLKALSKLQEKGDRYNLVFIGNGTQRDELERKTIEMNLSDVVWFYGACYDEKTNAELIYNADLCVSPGNVGLTAMHALMFGCPVITHNCFEWQMPEFEAINPGVTGDFFEMDDIDDLTSTITKWFRNHLFERERVRESCYDEIDRNWNPNYQMNVIKENLKF